MKEYVLDANAVLRYFAVGLGEGGPRVKKLFVQADGGEIHLSMASVNLGEVLYTLLKRMDDRSALDYIRTVQHRVTIVDADARRTLQAATLKHQYKLGYADSFAAALALELGATLVSADPDFEKIGKSLKWLRLPKFEPKR